MPSQTQISYLFPLPDLVEGLVDLLLPVVLQVVEVVVVHLRDELGARDVVQRLQDARERRTLVRVLLPTRCNDMYRALVHRHKPRFRRNMSS